MRNCTKFILLFLVVELSPICLVAQTKTSTKITIGSSLQAKGNARSISWLSPSGRFAFGFYPENKGFNIGIKLDDSKNGFVVWTARTDGKTPYSEDASLSFTEIGFLLTPAPGVNPTTLIKFNATGASAATMLDDGNFVVYSPRSANLVKKCRWDILKASLNSTAPIEIRDNSSCIIWQSFDYPTDTMMGGQDLPCGKALSSYTSDAGHSYYLLAMQCDSNLVIYAINRTVYANSTRTAHEDSTPIWVSDTYGQGYEVLALDEGGRLSLITEDGTTQGLSKYEGNDNQDDMLYRAKLEPDKYFRIYALNLSTNSSDMVYQVPTQNDDCQSGNPCGVNSYCLVSNNYADCRCIPGFDFINHSAQTEGCQRNQIMPSCPDDQDNTDFSMESVENLVLLDDAYSIVSLSSKEACYNTCLSECDCEAAIFKSQNCAKHKLPISRATRDTNDSGDPITVFFKIAATGKSEKQKRQVQLVALLMCAAMDAGVFLAVLAAGAGGYWVLFGRYWLQWRKWELALKEEIAPRCFSYKELAKATDMFNSKLELGRGGYGTVFEGYVDSYTSSRTVVVAVKRLDREVDQDSRDNRDRDFQAEARLIGRAHHVNLVRLLGFCHEDENRLLVYEFMSKGSLADHIFKPASSERLGPELRVQILIGVARGIHYLHRECETKIIHRDIKPENILIDGNWSAKISDFGISKLLMGIQTTATLTLAPGTQGYMAPECEDEDAGSPQVTEKMDVYSFGVVVLETVFSRRNREAGLCELARQCKKEEDVVRLMKNKQLNASELLERMLKVGILCVQLDPEARPLMEDVVLMLEGNMFAPRRFSYMELAKATDMFNLTLELGRGGYGTVFKGYVDSYTSSMYVLVAVKRLDREVDKDCRDNRDLDFQAEARLIWRAHHVNLVRLLGFCYEDENRLLVYEFMSNGSLADHIFMPDSSERLGPEQRAKILLGVARGIHYLHRECETKIIHRNIKPENILIAENWSAKISDFDISKLLMGIQTTTKLTLAPGMQGYMAPECEDEAAGSPQVTEKVDVYSFGVVVLETVFSSRNREAGLCDLARQCKKEEEVVRLMDSKQLNASELLERMLKVGILCVQLDPKARPLMKDVVLMLEGNMFVQV